jgi:hypothetical protein
MLIPRPVHIHWRKTVTANTCQLNTNNAATAPSGKDQKRCYWSSLFFESQLDRSGRRSRQSPSLALHPERTGITLAICNDCVIFPPVLRKYSTSRPSITSSRCHTCPRNMFQLGLLELFRITGPACLPTVARRAVGPEPISRLEGRGRRDREPNGERTCSILNIIRERQSI